MSSKYLELAQKNLESGDDIEKTYSGNCDRKYGHLLMSKKKLLFVSEEGLFSKKYSLVFDIPYDKLKTNPKGRYGLEVIDAEGKRHDLTFDISVSTVMKSLQDLMTPVHS